MTGVQTCAFRSSLASKVAAAEYLITIPADDAALIDMVESYLQQSRIIALKRKKKTGEYRPVNIASKIKSLKGSFVHDDYGSRFLIVAMLDAGSESNLNPELLISSFSEFTNLNIPREEISVHRTRLILR